jgi:hypothetical protein
MKAGNIWWDKMVQGLGGALQATDHIKGLYLTCMKVSIYTGI